MSTELFIGSVVATGFVALGAAKVAKAPSFLTRAAHVGFSAESYQLIGVAELAGAAGVLAGLAYSPVGYAAGLGLLALMAGAAGAHVRAGDGPAQLAPAIVFAAGVGAYLVALGVAR